MKKKLPKTAAERKRDSRARNPERAKAQGRKHSAEFKRNSPQKYILSRCKIRAKELGIECTILSEDVVIPAVCPALGIPLGFDVGTVDNSPSLDRLDNTKGYIPDNVAVISARANLIKRDATAEELESIAAWLRKS